MIAKPSRYSIIRTAPDGTTSTVLSNIGEHMAGALARLMERTTQTPGATYEAVKGAKR